MTNVHWLLWFTNNDKKKLTIDPNSSIHLFIRTFVHATIHVIPTNIHLDPLFGYCFIWNALHFCVACIFLLSVCLSLSFWTCIATTQCDTMTDDHLHIFRLNALNDCGIFVYVFMLMPAWTVISLPWDTLDAYFAWMHVWYFFWAKSLNKWMNEQTNAFHNISQSNHIYILTCDFFFGYWKLVMDNIIIQGVSILFYILIKYENLRLDF